MKIIVAHKSPDMDAVASIWFIKRFLHGWEDAILEFVPAGERLEGKYENRGETIEKIGDREVIHVDTGLGPLDHHQTKSNDVCAASLTYDFVKNSPQNSLHTNPTRLEAARRIVELVIDEDHFQEVYYPEALSTLYDFSIPRLIDGFKIKNYHEDALCAEFGMECLDTVLHVLEARIWAEGEIKEKGREFTTRWGKGMAIESLNDTTLEIIQKSGFAVAVRRDPKYGFIRIKAKPERRKHSLLHGSETNTEHVPVDLTPVYEKLKVADPNASWFLHISKKMLLNGSSKKPEVETSKLTLDQIIKILEEV